MIGLNFSPTVWADGWWNLVSIGFCQGLVSALLIGLFLCSLGRLASARLRYWLLVLLLVKLALPPLPGWGLFPWLSRVSEVERSSIDVVAVPAKAPVV